MATNSQRMAEAQSIASEYRAEMILVGIRRGMDPREATAFADKCVQEQADAAARERARRAAMRPRRK